MDTWKKWVEKEKSLKVMHFHKKLAPGPARNAAAQKASGEYIFCLDVDDKLVSADTLKKVIDGLDGKDVYVCSY